MVTGWTKAASHDVELMRQSAGSTGAAGRPGPARRLLSSLRWMAGFRSLAAEWSSRSHSFTEFGVLPGFTGVAVHDRYSVYDNRAFAGVGGHQICCAHILRDLQDAAEVYPGQHWPEQASRALRALIGGWHQALDGGQARVPADVTGPLVSQFRHAVRVGLSQVPSDLLHISYRCRSISLCLTFHAK